MGRHFIKISPGEGGTRKSGVAESGNGESGTGVGF